MEYGKKPRDIFGPKKGGRKNLDNELRNLYSTSDTTVIISTGIGWPEGCTSCGEIGAAYRAASENLKGSDPLRCDKIIKRGSG
jgi:hypothetical protein